MGHPHFHMIANNFSSFDAKIQSAKESVLNILGHQTGSTFFKKYLLVPSKNKNFTKIPINLSLKQTHEVSEQTEIFLRVNDQGKNNDKRIIESSIVRTGSNRAYTYTQKTLTEFKGQRIVKKKAISAAEYVDLESIAIKDMHPLKSTRVTTIDNGLYMIFDWYEQVELQPLTCIIQVNNQQLQDSGARIKTPDYLQIDKDITDMTEFRPLSLAKRIDPQLVIKKVNNESEKVQTK